MDSNSKNDSNDRRGFLQHMLGAGVAVAGSTLLTGCASNAAGMGAPVTAASGAPRTAANATPKTGSQPATEWDMSWQQKLGKYKTVYDSPSIDEGSALSYASSAAQGYKAALGVSMPEFTPVIVFRHLGTIMALNDDMWARLDAGTQNKLKDPTTGEPNSKRNPFVTYTKGDKSPYVTADSSISYIISQGGIVLACNRALTRIAGQLKNKEPNNFASTDLALKEIRRNLIPGVYAMPNGVFAMSAAQDAGCHYMRALA